MGSTAARKSRILVSSLAAELKNSRSRPSVGDDRVRKHQPVAQVFEIPAGWDRLVVREEESGSVGEADVQYFRFGSVHLETDSGAFFAEPGESTLGRVWISAQKSYIIGVGEGREWDGRVSAASAWSKQIAVLFSQGSSQDVVHQHDEKEGSQRVALEDSGGSAEFLGGAVGGLHECFGALV
jgi:hypothetical protein